MSIKILLADDSITIQKVIGIIFGGEEYSLTVVDNGKSALDMAREVSPDVLLIDAIMPGMSGYDVCEAIRATPALAEKPLLLLTGSFEPFDEAKARSCGADDFLAKPFDSQQIITKVREMYLLGVSRAATAPQAVEPAEPPSFEPPSYETPSIEPLSFEPPPFEPPIMPQEAWTAGGSIQEANPDDIWGAFTPSAEPAATAPLQTDAPESALGPDVFDIISEEARVRIAQPSDSSGANWIPVEEHTFEFEEESVAELPANAFSGLEALGQEDAFGDISFTEESPVYATAPPPPPEQTPVETPATAPFTEIAPVTLTEAQLKAAIAGVSQDVIERIVWEVVPDLAETLIKEAIRKIKEGL